MPSWEDFHIYDNLYDNSKEREERIVNLLNKAEFFC